LDWKLQNPILVIWILIKFDFLYLKKWGGGETAAPFFCCHTIVSYLPCHRIWISNIVQPEFMMSDLVGAYMNHAQNKAVLAK
jgi:hypothetical protein